MAAGVAAIACVVDNVETVAFTSEDAWAWAATPDCCAAAAALLWADRELPAETFVAFCEFCAFLAFSFSFSFFFRASLAE